MAVRSRDMRGSQKRYEKNTHKAPREYVIRNPT